MSAGPALMAGPVKCRYFCAAQRRKSPRSARRKPCAARLPGHLIPFEAGRCPLELPRPGRDSSCSIKMFEQTSAGPALMAGPVKCRYFCAAQRRKSPRSARRKPCAARLPGHLIPFEAGRCPLELPRPGRDSSCSIKMFEQTSAGPALMAGPAVLSFERQMQIR